VPTRAERRQAATPEGVTSQTRRGPRKGDIKEQAILATAESLLARRPLAEITIDQLARGAGITRPSFYFYFDSREAVVRALAARVGQAMYAASLGWLRRTDEAPADAIRRAVTANLRVWREHGPVLRAMGRSRDTDPEMARFWHSLADQYSTAIAAQIDRERAAGVAPPGPPRSRDLARALVAMTERFNDDASLVSPTPRGDRVLIDTLTTIWVRSIYGDVAPR
jgi:AcrR family transcriptional regulator